MSENQYLVLVEHPDGSWRKIQSEPIEAGYPEEACRRALEGAPWWVKNHRMVALTHWDIFLVNTRVERDVSAGEGLALFDYTPQPPPDTDDPLVEKEREAVT